MDLAWMTQSPKMPGLYWRRDGRKLAPQLTLVYVGAKGLMVRIIETRHSAVTLWNAIKKAIDHPMESFESGEWAGPLGPRREDQIIPSEDC